ncbi:MAG: hypothetical protein ACP6IY_22275, partial [Promethearchaeia archaeon]
MYNKNNLLINAITGDEKSKKILSGVLFKKDRTVATDLFKLIEVKNPDEMIDDSEFPKVGENIENFSEKGYILPAKSVKKILSNLNNIKNNDLPILKNCIFLKNDDKNSSKVATINAKHTDIDIVKVNNIGDYYPDYTEEIPNTDEFAYVKTKVNIKYLKKIIDTISKMNLSYEYINLFLSSEDKPIVIKT